MKHTCRIWLPILCAVAVTGGCGKKKVDLPPPAPAAQEPEPPAAPPAPPEPPPTPTAPPTEDEIFERMTLDELNAQRPLGDVFFDFDRSSITESATVTLQKHADWLRRWPSTRITIQGHCDSRGTAEYNLALGERRATATRDYLVSLGIAVERLQVVTRGEESPICSEENESCWQQNRRGHPVITAK